MKQSTCLVSLIHGRYDIVVVANSIEKFAAQLKGRAKIVVLNDAGQLTIYVKPKMVFERLSN